MNVAGLKARVRGKSGEVTDIGYTAVGSVTVAMVEVYFEDGVPSLNAMEMCHRVTVDDDWDPENGGVMFEVQV